MSSTRTIGEQLGSLLRLQEIDGKRYGLMKEKGEKPRLLEQYRKKRDERKTELTEAEKALTALQMKRKEKEIDLETKEGNVKKYQTQLYQVKTNKEYQSLQKEIETLKADNSVLEEEILQMMDEVDQKKREVSRLRQSLEAEEAELKQQEKRIAEEVIAIERELKSLKESREEIIPELERKLFEQYDRILAAKGGLALVPVRGDGCGGCNMNLPPQRINEVRLQEKWVMCENCSRILYDRGEGG